jgi:hypothetical protein
MQTVPPELAAQLRQMTDDQGWLPPWPQWWDDETLAGLIPGPAARRHFAASSPRLPVAMSRKFTRRRRSGPARLLLTFS